jgi:Tfp pilus assembly protein PilF
MSRTGCILLLAASLAGCVSPRDERVREYNADGVHLYTQGRYADARDSFQAALDLTPGDAGLLFNLGECCDRLDDPARAEQYYLQCLRLQPDHAACRASLIRLWVRTGRGGEAQRLVQDWLAREPQSAEAHAAAGWLAHQGGDLPQAQQLLQHALQLDPHNVRALIELGLVYEALERPARSVVLYERALRLQPQQPEVTARLNELVSRGVGRPKPD